MGLFQDEPPPLYVPDLSKPAGATVGTDGLVACVACGNRLPTAKMDIVGQGYRCAPCSHKAEIAGLAHGQNDIAANLSAADRASVSNAAAGGLVLAVLMLIGGIALFPVFAPQIKLPLALVIGGIITGAASFGKMRDMR